MAHRLLALIADGNYFGEAVCLQDLFFLIDRSRFSVTFATLIADPARGNVRWNGERVETWFYMQASGDVPAPILLSDLLQSKTLRYSFCDVAHAVIAQGGSLPTRLRAVGHGTRDYLNGTHRNDA
jgi:hypothetical protein